MNTKDNLSGRKIGRGCGVLEGTLRGCGKSGDALSMVHCFNNCRVIVTIKNVLHTTRLGVIVLMSNFVVAGYMLTTSRLCPRVLPCYVFKRYKSRTKRGHMLSVLRTGPLLGLNLHLNRNSNSMYTCPVISSTIHVVGRVRDFRRTSVAGCFWLLFGCWFPVRTPCPYHLCVFRPTAVLTAN